MFNQGDKIHLIGIKGVGMTALAQILVARGCEVTGSDGPAQFFTDEVLRRSRIPFVETFNQENIPKDVTTIVSSAAYLRDGVGLNEEAKAALTKGVPVLTYPEAIGELAQNYKVIAVAGSHGKSTTTALLGWIMQTIGMSPTVMVGTKVNGWEANAITGTSEYLVVEADEYREAFLNYKPHGVIVTSIDYDHPDYFKTPQMYEEAFVKLVNNVDAGGWLVGCGDDTAVMRLVARARERGVQALTYGFNTTNDLVLTDNGVSRQTQMFHVVFHKQDKGDAAISFPGKQYVLNSGAAVLAAHMAGASLSSAINAVASFAGTERRLQVLKLATEKEPAIVIDDYAHHPTAIAITLDGIKKLYPDKKIVAVFQPHMFSRTQALLKEFAQSFSAADEVGIMEVYPSAREVAGPVKGEDLARETKMFHKNATYLSDMASGKQFVKQHLGQPCVVVLMGAGDVNTLLS